MGLEYRKAYDVEMPLIIDMLKRNFDTQLSGHLSGQEILNFYNSIQFDSFSKRKKFSAMFVAKDVDNKKLAGIIELKFSGQISLFFVDEAYQRNGVGTRLLRLAEKEIIKSHLDLEKICVKSPVLTVDIYKRLGFQTTSQNYTNLGIVYIGMEKKISCRVI